VALPPANVAAHGERQCSTNVFSVGHNTTEI
jgi:hypothetical protein